MDEVSEICIPLQELTDEDDDQSSATPLKRNEVSRSSTLSSAEQIQDLERSIMEELESLEPLSDDCCIYRVPETLIKSRPGSYIPFKASIGPFHHGKEEYKEMQEHKRRYLVEFLEWTNMSLKDIIERLETHETRLRCCYAETIALDKQNFVKVMLIDATFLIVLLLKARFRSLRSNTDRIFGKQQLVNYLRISQRPKKPKPSIKVKKLVLPTIKELYDAGVMFEVHPSENKLDVEFDREKGVLKIPYFNINRETEALLKNLQQFEEFHCYPSKRYVNDYLCLLGMLVRDRKDVEILDRNGIIENWLGDNQMVATLFSSIRWSYHKEHFFFAEIIDDLNSFCKDPWNKINANLKQNYFNTPWSGISVAAAAFLLVLTVIQTVCSILQVT